MEDIQNSIIISEATRTHCSGMTHLGQRPKGNSKATVSIVNQKITKNNMEGRVDAAGGQSWMTVRALEANQSGWKENVKALCALWQGEIKG